MRGQGFFRGSSPTLYSKWWRALASPIIPQGGAGQLTSGGPHSLISNFYNFKLF